MSFWSWFFPKKTPCAPKRARLISAPLPIRVIIPMMIQGQVEQVSRDIPFGEFLSTCLSFHAPYKKGNAGAEAYDVALKMVMSFEGGKTHRIGAPLHAVLTEAAKVVTWATPDINRAYLPFYEAISKAEEEKV